MRVFAILIFLLASFYAFPQKKYPYIYAADSIAKGITLQDSAQYEEAIKLYDYVPSGDTNYARALYEKSYSLFENKQYHKAINVARKTFGITHDYDADLYDVIGNCYDELEMPDSAMLAYNKGLEKFPKYYLLHYNRAISLEKQKKYDRMLEDLKTAVALNPFHASSHLKLAEIALGEKQYAQALLSLGFFLMIEPKTHRANTALVHFNEAVSTNPDQEPRGITLSEKGDDFEKINLLITSFAALREDYKFKSEIGIPLIRQMYLVYSQSVKRKKLEGWWENYYIPFYQDMMAEDKFEPFSYAILLTSGNEAQQKILSKNISEINDFFTWAGPQIREHHEIHHLHYDPAQPEVKYWFYDEGKAVEAIGNVKDDKPVGDYTFYYSFGKKLSEGTFDNSGKRTGTWTYYFPNDTVKKIVKYKDDQLNGPYKEYFDNGRPYLTTTYKNDQFNGLTAVYNEDGYKDRVMIHKDGVIQDSLVYYFPDGKKKSYLPIEDGKVDGKAMYYNANGVLTSFVTFKDDKRNGPFEGYYADGSFAAKGIYKDDWYNGKYASYYPNGNKKSEGTYNEGKQIGEWKYYYYDGTLSSTASFDEKGKQNGIKKEYSPNGIKTDSLVFSKGEITEYTNFNRKGEVINQAKRKKGSFWYEGYSPDGVKKAEGSYASDHKEGTWKYYSDDGVLHLLENYNEDGELEGEQTYYFNTGKISHHTTFKNDLADGYDEYYYNTGQLSQQGYNTEGKANGVWTNYNRDGTLKSAEQYVKGDLNGPNFYYDPEGNLYLIKQFEMGILKKYEDCSKDSSVKRTVVFDNPDSPEVNYYPNGQKMFEIPNIGGHYYGKAFWYYGTGQMQTEGNFVDDQRDGDWKWYFPNGQLQTEGHYSLGDLSGTWKSYYEDGTPYSVSHYENGELQGEFTYYYSNGDIETKDNYVQGELNGKRYFYGYNNKLDHIRFYDHDRIIGYSYLDINGNEKSMIPIKNETAKVISYFPNGKQSRYYTIKNGDFVSLYMEYNSDGSRRSECIYDENGNEQGQKVTYDEHGNVLKKMIYKDGELNGQTIYYYPNGKVRKTVQYMNDERQGETIEYDENGKKQAAYIYKNDMLYDKL